ncbi:MAG: hypothetical protein HN712_27800 [Gemmatimonadetes bacterium]|jgi:hypothetical protein|nr:hypothetical protein [Gemmatimonadota bacterium]MBT6147724.1 hypothetical protein [Gemmatimonadota bacterium]MBT7864147.1 hypothetical protein [Gemmatimonadota bacterium]
MRIAPAPLDPIVKERTVPLELGKAFELFTARIGEWWPLATHSISGSTSSTVRFEPAVGGRIIEALADGTEHAWADVLAWDPPERFVVSWHPNPNPDAASTLEVRFHSVAEGTTIRLEHRGWEEFGQSQGLELREGYTSGWEVVLSGFTHQADGLAPIAT